MKQTMGQTGHNVSLSRLLRLMNPCNRQSQLARAATSSQPSKGQSLVEFGLIAPLAFLLIFGIVVTGIYIMNDIRISNTLRDVARAGAICSNTDGVPQNGVTINLPNGSPCSDSSYQSYVSNQLHQVDNTYNWLANTTITVYNATGSVAGTSLGACRAGYTLVVSTTYQQQLYLPLVGILFGNPANNTATLKGSGSATCETQ